jgi:hypothetical protein
MCFNDFEFGEQPKMNTIIANIYKLMVFGDLLQDINMMILIRNIRKIDDAKHVFEKLFTNNKILHWAIEHLDEKIDNIPVKADVYAVLKPWFKKVSKVSYKLEPDFNNQAFYALKYLIKTMQVPTLWVRFKNFVSKKLANLGLKDPSTIEKTDVEYFKIIFQKFSLKYSRENVAEYNEKVNELRNLASNQNNPAVRTEILRVLPQQQNTESDNLDWLANNRESSMRALNPVEKSAVNRLKNKYKIKA